MEIALRQAMSRSKSAEAPTEAPAPAKKSKGQQDNELDDILNRTLEQEPAS